MFTCRACQRRAFDALYRHGQSRNSNTSQYGLLPFRVPVKPSRPSRRYATVAIHARSATAADSTITSSPVNEYRGGKAPAVGRSAEWAARKELEYLGDPLHIANRVKLALDKDNFELAALITRQASKSHNVTVSWNYLIDYQLQKGRLHGAMKLYNEMKKRAQQPNAQTFTIIFRGCANSKHPGLAVGEAVKLYQNMLSVGRIKPNTIHLNAVLQVCAKARDLDSMFTILNSSNDQLRSPNNLTYTTIFNAMRMTIYDEPMDNNLSKHPPTREISKNQLKTIDRAKTIWQEVMSRWWSGSLIIDEELVCAMGRILLKGSYSDIDAIETLIEYTMMIPRVENKGLLARGVTKSTALAPPQPVTHAPGAPAITHALPGNNSLSMILEALEKTRRTTKAIKYWNVFTIHHKVVPDAENWARFFRVCYIGKNSGRAARALRHMPSDLLTPKHVRLAMKTCLRDNINKLALENATAVLKTMEQNPNALDIQSLRIYVQLGHASKQSLSRGAKDNDKSARESWAQSLFAALEHVFGPYEAVAKKYIIEAPITSDPKESERVQNSKGEVVALARKICAAYDVLSNEHAASLTEAQLATIKPRLGSLTRLINNYFQDNRYHLDKKAEKHEDAGDKRDETQNRKWRRWVDDEAFEDKFPKRVVPKFKSYSF
ncbi:hypothetical protein F5Y09DRAFT_65479 [Xylaria sp. FL1042]|nr:hypothetical protein F5Y09DRAFT_65479 [Xylaria sp. FL1042]